MDAYKEMRTFVAVVDAGSFVRAANVLGLSTTAVSRLIGELEARLGVRLLQRTTRRLSLTQEGDVFQQRCRDLLADLEQAEGEITASATEAAGHLRVNAPVSFGLTHLAPLWALFMAQHPNVVLDVTLTDRVVDLVDEGYDLAIRIGRLRSSSLVSRQLTSTRLVLCASPDYLREHDTLAHPSDLAEHAVIAYTLLAMGDQWDFDGPDGPVSVRVTPRMRSNSGDTCCAAALGHAGIVLQPSFLVDSHLRSGALVEILTDYRSIELGVHAVYPHRKYLPPKVRVLVEFLAQAWRSEE